MSLRALRRSAIAASSVLAIGGSLAIAGSASAVTFPWTGSSDSTAPATNSPYTSITQLNNVTATALVGAENILNGLGDANFTTQFTAASLTATNVATIAADFGGTTYGTTIDAEWAGVQAGEPSLASVTYSEFNSDVQSAATGWPQTAELLNDLAPFGATLASLDGDHDDQLNRDRDASQERRASTRRRWHRQRRRGAAEIPSALSVTFPSTLGLNTAPLIARLLSGSDGDADARPTRLERQP